MRRHLAVVHPSRHALLVARGADGRARLPFLDEEDGDARQVGGIAQHLGPHAPLVLLGTLAYGAPAADATEAGVVSEFLTLCELHPATEPQIVESFEWCERAEDIEPPAQLAKALGDLFEWLRSADRKQTDTPLAALPPHFRPGTTAALAEALAAALPEGLEEDRLTGGAQGGGLRQLQAWVLSSVWLGRHTVVKVTVPLWPQEPAVSALLSDMAPGTVPEVFAHGSLLLPGAATRSPWMATRRFEPLGPGTVPETADVLRALASLQARAHTRTEELLSAGVPVRGPREVAADLPVLWEVVAAAGLSGAERDGLPQLDAWLRGRLQQLAESAPLVLAHGDLHLGNVMSTAAGGANYGRGGGGLVIFDWTDAALAWPGVDLLTLTRYGLSRTPPPAEVETLKQEYLAAVREAFDQRQEAGAVAGIEASLDLGAELALAYHCVSYAHIVRSLPTPQKMFVGSGFLLRAVRDLLAHVADRP